MNCTLTSDQQEKLLGKVYSDLKTIVSQNDAFDLKNYVKGLHDLVLDKTNDPVLALHYAQITPEFISYILPSRRKELKTPLRNNGLDMNTLEDIIESFDDIKNVEDYIGVKQELVEELKSKKEVRDHRLTGNNDKSIEKDMSEQEMYNALHEELDRGILRHMMGSNFITTDLIGKELNPVIKTKLATLNNIGSMFDKDETVPYKLKAVKGNTLPIEHYSRPGSKFVENYKAGEKKAVKQHEEGVVLLITDTSGNVLNFDEAGKPTYSEEGNPVHLTFANVTKGTNEGEYTHFYRDNVQQSNDLAEELGLDQKKLQEFRNEQLETLYNIRESVKDGKEVILDISAAQEGAVDIVYDKGVLSPIKNLDVKSLNSRISFNVSSDNNIYISIDKLLHKVQDKRIGRLFKRKLTDSEIEDISSLLVDDLEVETLSGKVKLPLDQRRDLLNQFIYLHDSKVNMIFNQFAKETDRSHNIVLKGVKESKKNTISKDQVKEFLKDTNLDYRHNLINKNMSKPTIIDGVVSIETVPYNDFLIENGLVDLKVRSDFKLNPTVYFQVSENQPSQPLVTSTKESEKESEDVLKEYTNSEISKILRSSKPSFIEDYLGKEVSRVTNYFEKGKAQRITYTYGIIDNVTAQDGSEVSRLLQRDGNLVGTPNININIGLMERFNKVKFGKDGAYLQNEDITNLLKDSLGNPVEKDIKKDIKKEYKKKRGSRVDRLKNKFENNIDDSELLKRKNVLNSATEKEQAKAKEWFDNSPISKHVKLEELFNVANSEAFASWNKSGIRLFKGANYTDLYHESWHAFTQEFLTNEERSSLYNELKKKSGKFTNFKGERKTYKSATNLEIEELLAEDFRKYVLSGATKVLSKSPKRNTIFRRIYNYLKSLFSNGTYTQLMVNQGVNDKVQEMYEALHTGKISKKDYLYNKPSFNNLNKANITPLAIKGQEITREDSLMIRDSIDSLLSEYVNAKIQSSPAGAAWLTAFFKSPKFLVDGYKYVETELARQADSLSEQLVEETDEIKGDAIESKLDLLDYALDNWGDPLQALSEVQQKGVLHYHKQNSNILDISEKIFDQEDLKDLTDKTEGEIFDRGGNEFSTDQLAANEILFLFKSLSKKNKAGQAIKNELGFNELVDFKPLWFKTIGLLAGTKHFDQMIKKLDEASKTTPEYKELILKLGNVDSTNKNTFRSQTQFWDAFNKTIIPLISLNLNEENGESSFVMGKVASSLTQAKREINDTFKSIIDSPYINTSKDGINSLNKIKVVEDFGKKVGEDYKLNQKKALEFINAIGISLPNNKEVNKALALKEKGGSIPVNYLFDHIYNMSSLNPKYNELLGGRDEFGNMLEDIKITDITKSFSIAHPSHNIKSHQAGIINKLVQLHVDNTDKYSSYSVTNAAGERQQETSLNSSLTVLINGLNEANSWKEFVNQPEFKHYDFKVNNFSKHSVLFNKLFDFSDVDRGYPKKKSVTTNKNITLDLNNLSGLQHVVESEFQSGETTANLDKSSKMIFDVHAMLEFKYPELMRHADKGTSYGVTTGDLYIDSYKFDSHLGNEELLAQSFKYIQVELNRIARADEYKDVRVYNKNADSFTIFSGILKDETQAKLIKYAKDGNSVIDSAGEPMISDNTLKTEVIEDLNTYFKNLTEEFTEVYNQNNYISNGLTKSITSGITELKNKKELSEKEKNRVNKAIMSSYVANTFIHNFETAHMIYGDPAMFNHAKEEFHKRNAPVSSTGRLFRSDAYAQRYVENMFNPKTKEEGKHYSFAEKSGHQPLSLGSDLELGTAVVADYEIDSVYKETFQEAFEQDYLSKGLSAEEAKEFAAKDAKAYTNINTADAQGYLTIDAYKMLGELSGRWTSKQDELYNKLLNDEFVHPTAIAEFFPPRKYQYYGPLNTSDIHVTALHKYSLMPLIPQVIKGTNLEIFNSKLMKQGFAMGMFQSASKIGTLSSEGNQDIAYTEKGKFKKDGTFTNNPILLPYLKDQVDTHSHFKGKSTFPTQMRKLIISGLFEKGEAKNDITKGLEKNFITALNELQDLKKKALLKEMKWEVKNGELTGNLQDLLSFVEKELSRTELGEHELADLKVTNVKDLLLDLSYSPSAAKIEKLVTSLINRRLIRHNHKGEGLIQASSTMTESSSEFRNFEKPTQEDINKYGSNDLPFYNVKDGKIQPMGVKIALQGDFKKLLRLKDTEGNEIRTIKKLNKIIRNEEWLKDNASLIQMAGVRIPSQELNSFEYMQVYEFLEPSAGNVMIAPIEIVAKTGSDFDIDKMFVLMPHLFTETGKAVKNYTTAELKDIYDNKIKKAFEREEGFAFDQSSDELVRAMVGDIFDRPFSEEEHQEILSENKIPFTFEEFSDKYAEKMAENNLLDSITDVLAYEKNFTKLVKSIDGTDATDVADKLAKHNQERDHSKSIIPGVKNVSKGIKGTKIVEPLYNLDKHEVNNVSKKTLGIGAIFNTYNVILNRVGAYVEKNYNLPKDDIEFLLAKKLAGTLTKSELKDYNKILTFDMYLPHNKMKVGNEEYISFSSERDANNKLAVGDVISQLMNGWVDVAKDTWVFNLQGNVELAPTLMTMLKTGVPLEIAATFLSTPMVKEYVKNQRVHKSPIAKLMLGQDPAPKSAIRSEARNKVLVDNNLSHLIDVTVNGDFYNLKGGQTFVKKTLKDFKKLTSDQQLAKIQAIVNKKGDPILEKALFLNFLQLEQLSSDLTKLTSNSNFDTKNVTNLFEGLSRKDNLDSMKTKSLFPSKVIDEISNVSAVGPFDIIDIQEDITNELFPVRNNRLLNYRLVSYNKEKWFKDSILKATYKDPVKTVEMIKNDIMIYSYQQALYEFDTTDINTYSEWAKEKGLKFKESKQDKAVIIKDNTLFLNKDLLDKNFKNAEYSKGDNPVSIHAFMSGFSTQSSLYHPFVLEKEYLKSKDDSLTGEELNTKALFNTNNIWAMFSAPNNLPSQILDVINRHPELKKDFSLIRSLRKTSSELRNQTINNIGLKETKLDDKEIIDTYYKEFSDLADYSVKKVEDPKANTEISELFNKLIPFSFIQSGFNSNNNYNISRIIPKEGIVATLKSKKDDIQELIADEKTFKKFLNLFASNNSNPASRNRIKVYNSTVKSDKVLQEKPEVEKEVEIAIEKTKDNYRGLPVKDSSEIVTQEGTRGAAKFDRTNNEILVDRTLLKQKFEEKAWTNPRKLIETLHNETIESSAKALKEDQFKTYEEWENFVIEHEYQHSLYSRSDFNKEHPQGDKGQYESIINNRALTALGNPKIDFIIKDFYNELSIVDQEKLGKLDDLLLKYEDFKFAYDNEEDFINSLKCNL